MATSKRAKEARQKKQAREKAQRQRAKSIAPKPKRVFKDYEPKNETYRPDEKQYPSLKTSEYNTAKRESNQYTGTLIKGVMETHKSNLIPVVDNEHIVAITRMRRG